MSGNDLGDFLRAHRARLKPEDVGPHLVRAGPGRQLVIRHPAAGDTGAENQALLGTLSATRQRETPGRCR